MLLVVALAAHAILIAWLRRTLRAGALVTWLLIAGGVGLSLALFGPREDFGYTSFELSVVALGSGLLVAALVARNIVERARTRIGRIFSDKSEPSIPTATATATATLIEPSTLAPISTSTEPSSLTSISTKPSTSTLTEPSTLTSTSTSTDPSTSTESPRGRRAAFVTLAGGVSWAVSAGALGWGAVRGRHEYELVEISVAIPGLPRTLDGYTIVQISDLHIGEFVGETDLSRGLELVTRARPDLLVVTGDLVDFDAGFAAMAASRIASIKPRDGILGILGNHDYYSDADAVHAALSGAGIDVLLNQHRVLRAGDGGGFVIGGLDDLSANRYGGRGPDVAHAFANAPAQVPRILLAHQPRQFDETAGSIALQLSGHTHGLQFDFAACAGRLMNKYVSGRYEKNGSVLWVNRGFGVTGPPSRVGVPPEITKIVLAAG